MQTAAFSHTNLARARLDSSNNYISHQLTANRLVVTTEQGKVSLSAYGEQAIEVHYFITNKNLNALAKNAAKLSSFAIKEGAAKQLLLESSFMLTNKADVLEFSSDRLTAVITKAPFNIAFYNTQGQERQLLLAEESGYFSGTRLDNDKQYEVQGFRFHLSKNEKLLGGGEKFDKEMYIRWLQYGVFQPIYRPHGQDNIASEVVFHDKETQDILRKFIKLRYNLLPYNYTLAYQNSTTGMPLMRPMFFENELDSTLIDNAKSYLWGDAFLITPVVDAGVKSVSVTLPKGVWFDYFTEAKHQGNKTIEMATNLETLPVLVRAGSFIPMIDDIKSTLNYDNSTLTLHYYADKSVSSANYEMYEDDGEMFQANAQGLFELLSFEANQQGGKLSIRLSRNDTHYVGMPQSRQMTLAIHNWPSQPTSFTLGGKEATQLNWDKLNWDKKTKILIVKFAWQHQALTVDIL